MLLLPMARPRKTRVDGAGAGDALAVKPISLKDVAEHVGLSPTTVSFVLNNAPAARSIPRETKDRVFAAARELNYRPNFFARSLRQKRTFTIGVLISEISEGYATSIMSGLEEKLMTEGYFYFVAGHRGKPDLIEEIPQLLAERLVEGFILINSPIEHALPAPTVAIPGHRRLKNVTNIVLDHELAASLALRHLWELGHRRIAFFKGHPKSADTEARWGAIARCAQELGLRIDDRLVIQLPGDTWDYYDPAAGYSEGYAFGQRLLSAGLPFSALFAFNDISAIGAMRALQEAGLRIPQDVSVIGFDDISVAAFQSPRLTTVRQPLREMGELAAVTLLERIAGGEEKPEIVVKPELILRDSTAPSGERAKTAPVLRPVKV